MIIDINKQQAGLCNNDSYNNISNLAKRALKRLDGLSNCIEHTIKDPEGKAFFLQQIEVTKDYLNDIMALDK